VVPVVIVVVVVVVAGAVTGWMVGTGRIGASKPTSPASYIEPSTSENVPTSTASGMPPSGAPVPASDIGTFVPFDPTDGLPEAVGVTQTWAVTSGVLVMNLQDPSDYGQSVLRGFDAGSGALLWTYSTLPDGHQPRSLSFDVSDDKVAVAAVEMSDENGSSCILDTYILVLAAKTGEVLGSNDLPRRCDDSVQDFQTLAAYRDGVIVTSRFATANIFDDGTQSSAVAYQDTDLTKPLWSVPAADNIDRGQYGPMSVVVGDWIQTKDGRWVSLRDGQSGPYPPGSTVWQTGDFVAQTESDGTTTQVTSWDGASQRWTFTNSGEWSLYAAWSSDCVTADAIMVLLINRSYQYSVGALSSVDGHLLWSSNLGGQLDNLTVLNQMWQCAMVTDGQGRTMAAVVSPSEVTLFDPVTGDQGASTPLTGDVLEWASPCGTYLCVQSSSDNQDMNLTVVDVTAPTPQVAAIPIHGNYYSDGDSFTIMGQNDAGQWLMWTP